jgi:sugar lactone lactonase YvrE
MYYIDTVKLGVDRFDFDLESGKLSNKTKLITIDPSDGYPDGMTIDAEGMLWVAHWGGWQITRWDPSNGKKIGSIRMPASQITSICFGGTDFKQMYVTSARRGLSAEQLIKEPLAGSTFVIEGSGFVGNALYLFKVDPLLKELN